MGLIEAAWRVLPAVEELPIAEMWTGLRPGSRDDAPIMGPTAIDGLVLATGHHRNGILLTPASADAVAAFVREGELPGWAAPFTLARFARPAAEKPPAEKPPAEKPPAEKPEAEKPPAENPTVRKGA
jgi:glycine oxidase